MEDFLRRLPYRGANSRGVEFTCEGAVSWTQHYPLSNEPTGTAAQERALSLQLPDRQQDDSQEAGQQDVSALFVTGLVPIACYLQKQITVRQDFLLRLRLPILFVSSLSLHRHLLTSYLR